MGRIEENTDKRIMNPNEIAFYILKSCQSIKNFDAYMFGSTLHGIGEDIDILIVGPGDDTLLHLKRELLAAGEFLPLHILYMLPSEERHTEFVSREKCVPLTKLATLTG